MAQRHEWKAIQDLVFLMKRVKVRWIHLAVPAGLSLVGAFFEGAGMGLLIPLLAGFLQKDFSFTKDVPVLGGILAQMPSWLTSSDRTLFVSMMILFVVAIVLKNVIRYAATLSIAYFTSRFIHQLRRQLFGRFLTFGKLYYDKTSVGQHTNALYEAPVLASEPLSSMDRYFYAFFSAASYAVVMSLISWRLTLAAIPLFLVLHFAVRRVIVQVGKYSFRLVQKRAALERNIVEKLGMLPLIRTFGTADMEQKKFAELSNDRAVTDFRLAIYQQLLSPLQELITLLGALVLFAGMLHILVQDKTTTPSAFIVYFYMIVNASNRFNTLTGVRSALANASGPLALVVSIYNNQDKQIVSEGTETFPGLQNTISFKKLQFAYNKDVQVLSGATFDVQKGSLTALVGPTGAGKTTIIHLLMRLYDAPMDSIFIDGKDIHSFTTDSLLQHMALVSQEVYLLHETLEYNIRYGAPDVSKEEFEAVIKQAKLEDVVKRLPQGINTVIGDRGTQLSGGEKQRVSLARALIRKADILILDEATSSLDSRTERLIQEAIGNAIEGKTAIVIAHRLSTIQHADTIVVIENGKVAEQGTWADLQKKEGLFKTLWQEQSFA